jgi:hypothetical protein
MKTPRTHRADGIYGLSIDDIYDPSKLDLCNRARAIFSFVAFGKANDTTTAENKRKIPITLALLDNLNRVADLTDNDIYDSLNSLVSWLCDHDKISAREQRDIEEADDILVEFMNVMWARAVREGLVVVERCSQCHQPLPLEPAAP